MRSKRSGDRDVARSLWMTSPGLELARADAVAFLKLAPSVASVIVGAAPDVDAMQRLVHALVTRLDALRPDGLSRRHARRARDRSRAEEIAVSRSFSPAV